MIDATHCIELWQDRNGVSHYSKVKPINEFNKSMATSKRYIKKYGFKTIALFRIKFKS